MKSVSSSDLSAAYRAPEPSSAGANAFGGPRRRGTDVLMAINVAVFLAQFVSKDKLLLMGAKVVLLTLPDSSSIHGPRVPCLTCIHMHLSIGTGCLLSTAVMPYRPTLRVVRPLIQCFLLRLADYPLWLTYALGLLSCLPCAWKPIYKSHMLLNWNKSTVLTSFFGTLKHATLPDLPVSSIVQYTAPLDTVSCLLTQCVALNSLLH